MDWTERSMVNRSWMVRSFGTGELEIGAFQSYKEFTGWVIHWFLGQLVQDDTTDRG